MGPPQRLASPFTPEGSRGLPASAAIALAWALACLVGVGALGLLALEEHTAAAADVHHSLQVSASVERTWRHLAEAEGGHRGYLLTGSPEERERYDTAREDAKESLAYLRALVSDDPVQEARVGGLSPLVDRVLADFDSHMALERAGRHEDALADVRTGTATATMARIRDGLVAIQNGETALLNSRSAQAATLRNALLARTAAAVVVTGVSLAGITLLLADERRRMSLSERHFRRIFESATEGIAIVDPVGRFTAVNPAMSDLLGYAAEDLVGREQWDFMFPEDVPAARALFERRQGGIADDADLRFRHRSGREVWALLSARSIRGPGGRYEGALDFFTDVTDRRQAERRTAFLAALGERLLEAERREDVVTTACDEVTRFLGTDGCRVVEIAPDAAPDAPEASLRIPRPLVISDRMAVPLPALAQLLEREDARAILAIPRLRDGLCVAVLCTWSRPARAWAPGEVALLSAVADRVWLALENARLRGDLARRYRELDALYANAAVGLAHVDREWRFVRVNAEVAEMDGVPVEQHIGRPLREVLPGKGVRIGPMLEAVFARGETIRAREVSADDPNALGGTRYLLAGVYPLREPDGTIVGAGIVVQDITRLRHAESALSRQSVLLRVLSDTVPDLVYAKARDMRFLLANPATLRALGRTEELVLGRSALEWMDPDQAQPVWENDERVMREGITVRVEEEFGPPDDVRIYEAVKAPLRDERGEIVGLVAVSRDVTEQRTYARNLERIVEERTASLRQSLASLEELLYSIAHDLRAPNRAVHSYAELLERELPPPLAENTRTYLARIRTAALRNDELIHDLLEYGRLAHAEIPLEAVDLEDVMAEALLDVEPQARDRHARIDIARPLPRVHANRTLLKQILVNLLGNALKFVPTDRTPEVRVSARMGDDTAVVRVADNGPGIPGEYARRVFEPFVRLASGAEAPGTGMGLAIAHKAAERMGGDLTLEPCEAGACFDVRLPLEREVSAPRPPS